MFKVGDTVKTKCDGRVGVIASSWQYAGSVVYEIEFFDSGKIETYSSHILELMTPKKGQSLSVCVDGGATTISANERLSSEKIKKILDIIYQ